MRRVILMCVLGAGTVAGCGSSSPRVVSAVAGLPEYTAADAAIFGDTLSASVFGLPPELPPRDDPKLAERAQRADTIVGARIATVSAESLAGVHGYTLSIVTDPTPIAGAAPESQIELRIGPGNPSLSRVQTADTSLMGRRFLLFSRRYADEGEPVLHFHGEADNPEVRKAIESAKALDAVGDRVQTPR
ncbi:MAG TPA: hypothetical protein VF395_09240 [Polyangiaceae bacterium]